MACLAGDPGKNEALNQCCSELTVAQLQFYNIGSTPQVSRDVNGTKKYAGQKEFGGSHGSI